MQEITNYIVEKFRINKDIKLNKFYNDDKICCLKVKEYTFSDNISLWIYPPFKLKEINEENKSLTYRVPSNKKEITIDYFVNSHNYYQYKGYSSYETILFLSWLDMKEFLNMLLKEKVFSQNYNQNNLIKILTDKYFDKKFNIENKEIEYCDLSGEGAVRYFEKPKDLKEFINKFYTIDN